MPLPGHDQFAQRKLYRRYRKRQNRDRFCSTFGVGKSRKVTRYCSLSNGDRAAQDLIGASCGHVAPAVLPPVRPTHTTVKWLGMKNSLLLVIAPMLTKIRVALGVPVPGKYRFAPTWQKKAIGEGEEAVRTGHSLIQVATVSDGSPEVVEYLQR